MPHTASGAAQRGRPSDPRKDSQILEAATRLFMQAGVQSTTMEQIAREADVSKLTLYRRYPDKNTLFTEVISSKCNQYMPEDIFDATAGTDPAAILTRVGSALMELITSQDAVNLNRVITSESAHNPTLTAQFDRSGPQRVKSGMLQMMTTLKAHGLNLGDPSLAADMFGALIVGSDLNKRCAIHMAPTPTPEQIETYVKQAVTFFLRACS